MIPKVVAAWNDTSALKSHEWVISTDAGNTNAKHKMRDIQKRFSALKFVLNEGPRNCVAGWNTCAANCTGDILIAVADDFVPPKNWDTSLVSCAPEGWWNEDRAVIVDDGFGHFITTLMVCTRKRMEALGYYIYPFYESYYCDLEFGAHAACEGKLIDARNLYFEHIHWAKGKRSKDAIDRAHASPERVRKGRELYEYRSSLGFPKGTGKTNPNPSFPFNAKA